MQSVLSDYLTALKQFTSELATGEHLLLFFQNLGADGGNIWFSNGIDEPSTWNSEATSYSSDCLDTMYGFDRPNELTTPQLVSNSRHYVRVGWDIDRYHFDKASADYAFSQIIHLDCQMRNAIITPIPTVGFIGSSGISCYTSEPIVKFDKLLSEKGTEIALASYATHLHMQHLQNQPTFSIKLSAREKECLLWLAKGLRTKEISYKLNLREVTINLYITNARKKLSASTREEAIAKAILLKLITP